MGAVNLPEAEGVREYDEGYPVQIGFQPEFGRVVVEARNEGGFNCVEIDLLDMLEWAMKHPEMTAPFEVRARANDIAIAAPYEPVRGQQPQSKEILASSPKAADEAGNRPNVDQYAQARWEDYIRRCRELQEARLQREEVVRNHGTCE